MPLQALGQQLDSTIVDVHIHDSGIKLLAILVLQIFGECLAGIFNQLTVATV